ncbi:MAG: DUF1007 family protein [Alphaproteobacteria bacterium]|nr:DUF1007 family protein [Alphaproteobacteria bacterium]MBV8411438.1 DUF1007 family protein [Alphaproteobacteria bacterium]
MRRPLAKLAALVALLLPAVASAHPHIWIQQRVRVIAKDGKVTHVELEWRFDPLSSEIEIPAIDEDQDGKVSPHENKLLVQDTLRELGKIGYMTWLNTGGSDFHPKQAASFAARIEDPASFTPPEWDRNAGDKTMPMPQNKRVSGPPGPRKKGPRNLVYVMRFALPEPSKTVSITSFDAEDFVRIEVDKHALPQGCTLAKHPSYKAEFIPGYPVFADLVTCKLP